MASWPRVVRGLRTIGWDLRRVVRGGKTLWRQLRSPEHVDIGLGVFSAASHHVVAGQPQRYSIRIANACAETRHVKLSFDIYMADQPRHPEGHYAYITKWLAIDPKAACPVEIDYDWLSTVRLVVGVVAVPPDTFWRGDVQPPQLCLVQAIVYDDEGRELDRLTIYQEVTG